MIKRYDLLQFKYHLSSNYFFLKTILVDIPLMLIGGYSLIVFMGRYFHLIFNGIFDSEFGIQSAVLIVSLCLYLLSENIRSNKFKFVADLYENSFVEIGYFLFSFSLVTLSTLILATLFPHVFPNLSEVFWDTYKYYLDQLPNILKPLVGSPVIYFIYALFFDSWSYLNNVITKFNWDNQFGDVSLTKKKVDASFDLQKFVVATHPNSSEYDSMVIEFDLAKDKSAILITELGEFRMNLLKLYFIDDINNLYIADTSKLNAVDFAKRVQAVLT